MLAIGSSTYMTCAQNFNTDGNGIRQVVTAEVEDNNVFYISELDGAVSSYTLDGRKRWRNIPDIPAVMFEIESADVTGDGNEELLAASANGSIYCWKSNGRLLWKFTPDHKVRFSEIAVVKNGTGTQIFAGGNDFTLYEIDARGRPISQTKIEGVVRKLESGDFLIDGQQVLFLMTYVHDKFRWETFGFIDPASKKVISTLDHKKAPSKELGKMMVTDLSVSDINGDGLDDILVFGSDSKAIFFGLDGKYNEISRFLGSRKQFQRYAHTQGVSLLPVRNEIALQYGGILYVCDPTGKLLSTSGQKYGSIVFSDLTLDAKFGCLFGAGEVDGGNGMYLYKLEKMNWSKQQHKLEGRMTEVSSNIQKLYDQTLAFQMPEYQTPSDKSWVMVTSIEENPEVAKLKGADVEYVIQKTWHEGTDRSDLVAEIGELALRKDRRGKYTNSREDIISRVKEFEATGQPFTLWAGHGNDPFYLRIETMEAILKAAPNTCRGFVYAEMDKVEDPRVLHFIREYVPRLATAIRAKGGNAKLYFRYKNMFWATTSHLSVWQELFFSGKYNDILAPASEDTSSRTQEINLSGRVGMFMAGYVDDFAMRLVDDNPTSWRPLSPGGQRSVSPYLRQGAMMAAYGAKHGVIINNNFTEAPGLNVLFALMKSGVLPIVDKDDILSVGSWHLIQDVDKHLVHTIDNHHKVDQYSPEDEEAVLSVGQMHWAGTNLPDHDFSKIALGVDYRWLNYMPEMPHGMVPIAPIEVAKKLKTQSTPYVVSTAKVGVVDGEKVPARDFGRHIQTTVEDGDKRMPVLVDGASWSAIRLDDSHIRVILADPGYINPRDRDVVITFQGEQPGSAVDILTKEEFQLLHNKVKLTVPAGSLRFVDLSY